MTRYAHIVTNGDTLPLTVQNGVQIGRIADYAPKGPPGNHLHFDVMLNYKDNPGDWPGMDLARLKLDYTDPVLWLKQRGK